MRTLSERVLESLDEVVPGDRFDSLEWLEGMSRLEFMNCLDDAVQGMFDEFESKISNPHYGKMK